MYKWIYEDFTSDVWSYTKVSLYALWVEIIRTQNHLTFFSQSIDFHHNTVFVIYDLWYLPSTPEIRDTTLMKNLKNGVMISSNMIQGEIKVNCCLYL